MKKLVRINKYLFPLLIAVGIASCSFVSNPGTDNVNQMSSEKTYTADFGNGKKGANITLRLDNQSGTFNTKANANGNAIVNTTSQIRSYQLYLVKSSVGTGYPQGDDPLGIDKVIGPVVVDVDFAPSHTINLSNVPASTFAFGSGNYFYLAVRAWSGANATGTELIKPNNGNAYSWGGATATTPNVAVSTGAGLQVRVNDFSVSTTTPINVTANLYTAFGAGIETRIQPTPAAIPGLASSYIFRTRVSIVAGNQINNSTDTGIATTSSFRNCRGVAVDSSGNLYISDLDISTVRKVTPAGVMTTIAGTPDVRGYFDDGIATNAQLSDPQGIAVDNYGNVYIADQSNHIVRKVTPSGTIITIAGTPGIYGSSSTGVATSSQIFGPRGVAVDNAGNVYIADTFNGAIRKVTPDGAFSTIAGIPGSTGYSDTGTAVTSQLDFPWGVAVDNAGNVYIGDTGNSIVRKVTPGGAISTVAGMPEARGSANTGIATTSELNDPYGVVLDNTGNLYIADQNNHTIRKVTPGGAISTIAGITGSFGGTFTGIGTTSQFDLPFGIALDSSGSIYVGNAGNRTVRKVK